jgi:hypothetical protein
MTASDYPASWDEIPEEGSTLAPKALKRETFSLELRHVGGAVKRVLVQEASENGVLHVHWPDAVGSALYAIRCFGSEREKTSGAENALLHKGGPGWLYKTARSRTPLDWSTDAEAARELWRRMTGRTERKEWVAIWQNGQRKWITK